jgi:hypothetical protein
LLSFLLFQPAAIFGRLFRSNLFFHSLAGEFHLPDSTSDVSQTVLHHGNWLEFRRAML